MPYKNKTDRDAQRERWLSTRDENYIRDYQLKRNYGISLEQFNILAEAQNWRCKICGYLPDPSAKHNQSVLHVDHDHVTGRVRGLLCPKCNRGLGLLGDDPNLLQKAIDYLADGGGEL
jgi:hypothetical protein